MDAKPYTPQPIPTDGAELGEDLIALQERLAEHVHDTWALGRMAEGWTHGPQRDDNKKEHPHLVPYDELPDSEKQYDRATAQATLKGILSLGYKISHQG